MNRPLRCSRPAAVLGLLLMILLLGGWGVMSLAPQSALGRLLASVTGKGLGNDGDGPGGADGANGANGTAGGKNGTKKG
ncbi:MAG: hypothetical protein EOP86_26990, partial [Verrucomicrobiaceae bacterium]